MATARKTPARPTAKKATARPSAKKAPARPVVAVEELEEEETPRSSGHATLEDLEAEAAELPEREPFTVDLGEDEDGEQIIIEIGDPGQVPFSIAASGTLDQVFTWAMAEEDWIKFVDANLTTKQAGIVYKLWRRHYGMGTPGE